MSGTDQFRSIWTSLREFSNNTHEITELIQTNNDYNNDMDHLLIFLLSRGEYIREEPSPSLTRNVDIDGFVKNTTSIDICPICILETRDNGVKTMCNHIYHRECLEKTLRYITTCAICRRNLIRD